MSRYDKETDMFFFRDPGSESEICAIGNDELERCFVCKETDLDLIVVKLM